MTRVSQDLIALRVCRYISSCGCLCGLQGSAAGALHGQLLSSAVRIGEAVHTEAFAPPIGRAVPPMRIGSPEIRGGLKAAERCFKSGGPAFG